MRELMLVENRDGQFAFEPKLDNYFRQLFIMTNYRDKPLYYFEGQYITNDPDYKDIKEDFLRQVGDVKEVVDFIVRDKEYCNPPNGKLLVVNFEGSLIRDE